MIPDIMAGIGIQMILMFSCGVFIGLVLGASYNYAKIVEKLKKADDEGKSLKDAIKEITIDDDDVESGVENAND